MKKWKLQEGTEKKDRLKQLNQELRKLQVQKEEKGQMANFVSEGRR